MGCRFKSMSPAQTYVRYFAFTKEGYKDAVDDAKRESGRRSSGTIDVNLECGTKDIFLVTCDGPKTCTTKFAARPHGGLGGVKRKRRR